MPFEYNGATISAHAITIGEEEDASIIGGNVLTDPNGYVLVKHIRFGEYMVAHESDGAEPVPLVTASSTPAEVQASYAAWRNLPRTFAVQWRAELTAAEAPKASPQQR